MRSENIGSEIPAIPRKRGRPRSERARRAILTAALDLAADEGARQVTMEAIANRAGVSKETLYRWWRSKGDVLLEALAARGDEVIPIPNTGRLPADLHAFMRATADALDPPTRRVLRALAAEAAADPGFAEKMRDQFLARRRAALATVLERGVERGEIPAERVAPALDFIYGTLWYRLIFAIAPLDRSWAATVTDAIAGRNANS
jgi:AcrR family transcriptional regulator